MVSSCCRTNKEGGCEKAGTALWAQPAASPVCPRGFASSPTPGQVTSTEALQLQLFLGRVTAVLFVLGSCGTSTSQCPQDRPRVWCAGGTVGSSGASSLLLAEGKWILNPMKEGQLVHCADPTAQGPHFFHCITSLLFSDAPKSTLCPTGLDHPNRFLLEGAVLSLMQNAHKTAIL